LELISKAIEESGLPPTRAEIANQLGFASANAAEEHLRALAKKVTSNSRQELLAAFVFHNDLTKRIMPINIAKCHCHLEHYNSSHCH
jgi:SOS-response transcriptional repressor LexA